MKQKLIYTFLLFFSATICFSQVNFTAKANKNRVALNERLQITFSVDKDGDNFRPPSFSGFSAQGPSQSVSTQWINGKSSYKKSFTYYLTPKKKGKFTVGQASIQIGGQTYKTTPISIAVTEAVKNPTDGVNPGYVADKKVHFVARVSNPNPYLNEAVTLEYILYWDENIGIYNPQQKEQPKFKDFWSQEIGPTQNLEPKRGTYKGEPYAYVVFKKYVLYPQKTGKLKLLPFTLDIPISVPTNKRDFFGRRISNTVNKTVTAGRTVINVKPLPENAPDGFTGAVGNFNFKVTQSKAALNASESLQVKVQASGTGNLKLFKLPELKVPAAIEKYDPEHKENVRVKRKGMTGSITDTYTLVPQYKGKFLLPNLAFSFFDPKAKSYKTVGAQNVSIDVVEGPTQSNSISQNSVSKNTEVQAKEQQSTPQKSEPFRFIKKEAKLKGTQKPMFFKTTNYWLLLLLPLIAIPIVVLITKKSASLAADVEGSKARRASRLAKKYLSTAKKNLGDSKAFYVSLEKALHNYLKARLKIETSEMNKDNIQSLLSDKGVGEEASNQFLSVIETCEMARYTPSTLQTMKEDYKKASDAISLIDKQL